MIKKKLKKSSIYIEGLGEVIIPERNTEKEIRKIAELIIADKLPSEVLDIKKNQTKRQNLLTVNQKMVQS